MLTFNDIKPYLNTTVIDISKVSFLTALTESATDYVEHYVNFTIDNTSPKGLIKAVADMVSFHYTNRTDIESLKSEDMEIVYATKLPNSTKNLLNQYRRLKW